MTAKVPIDHDRIVEFCRRWKVAELSLFGSVLRDDFRPDSDVDVLVEWETGTSIGFITLGEMAAELSNRCRRNGIQGSHTDFLICSFSMNNNCPIFTLDKDFDLYRKHIPLSLHKVRRELGE